MRDFGLAKKVIVLVNVKSFKEKFGSAWKKNMGYGI